MKDLPNPFASSYGSGRPPEHEPEPEPLRWLTFVAVALMMTTIAAVLLALILYNPTSYEPSKSIVRLEYKEGHGSSVYIGGGYYITAAHVVSEVFKDLKDGDYPSIVIKFEDNSIEQGNVLWSNPRYDIGIVHLTQDKQKNHAIEAAKVADVMPDAGSMISAVGYPLTLPMSISKGVLSSGPITYEPWRSVYMTDAQIAPGMSGGGIFDGSGDLVGIIVGYGVQPGQGPFPLRSGFNIVVPINVVCTLAVGCDVGNHYDGGL